MKHFEATLQKAMDDVKLILDSQKCITLPQDKHHVYEDKFSLAERCSLLSLASQANCFSTVLGLTDEAWLEARACIDRGSEVSLRFRAEERCHFLREETREVEDESQFFSQFSSIGQVLGLTSKTVTKVTEYFWNFEVTYTWELLPQHRVVSSLVHSSELKSQSRQTPRPEVVVPALCEDVIISFLVKHLDFSSLPSVIPRFEIPRGSSKTKTPRRNAEVEEMWCYMTSMSRFLSSIYSYIKTLRQDVVRLGHGQSFPSINAEAIFIPTLPLFVSDGDERVQTGDADGNLTMSVKLNDMQSCMSSANSNRLLEEEMRTLAVKKQEVSDEVEGRGVFSTEEAFCFVALEHSVQVITRWMNCLNFIENLLHRQLVAAIGHSVSSSDFDRYMRFHHQKLFIESYQPRPFSYAVRRTHNHCAEGMLSIEDSNQGALVCSMCSKKSNQNMKFSLNASTTVSFTGDVHVHGLLAHQFSGTKTSLSLMSRARQFSCFMVLLGRVISSQQFDPSYAMLLQNLDELRIPLKLSTIPTPKDFKDAIESLSVEQQQFAKAFRAMQLESTLCGILVIQIKPQLEKVLKLPEDGLTKEIKLTQDLLELFIKYQIPSDLLSSEAGPAAPSTIDEVKLRVAEMMSMIEMEKEKELQDKRTRDFGSKMLTPMGFVNSREAELKIQHVKDCLKESVEATLKRGESLEVLAKKADDLSGSSKQFYKTAKRSSVFYSMPSAISSSSSRTAVPPAPCAPVVPAVSGSQEPQSSIHRSSNKEQVRQKPSPSEQKPSQAPEAPPTKRLEDMAATSPTVEPPRGNSSCSDVTEIPKQLDANFEKLDTSNSVRPTIITPEETWTKRSQKGLLAKAKTEMIRAEQIKREKNAAFDLLDMITKSGALPLSHATLHVVLCATHCFDKTLMETVIQENLNPIAELERSSILMASTIHGESIVKLLKDDVSLERLRLPDTSRPKLLQKLKEETAAS